MLNAIKNFLVLIQLMWKAVLPATGLKQKTFKAIKPIKIYYYFSDLRRIIVIVVYCFGVLSFADHKTNKSGEQILIAVGIYFPSLCLWTNCSVFSNYKLFYISSKRTG